MPMNQSKLTAIIGVGEPGKSQIFVRTVETPVGGEAIDNQSGGRGLKNLQCGPLFFKYFQQLKEKQRPSLSSFCHFCS